ncbi:Arginine--tRNA ligase [Candidatus Rubidus massiliensis]|nr:Arginine--tRNA ligase [Candidatus Rubidus massiliensis]
MKSLIALIQDDFETACHALFPSVNQEEIPLEITVSTQEKFGHYQFNSAMKLTKILQTNPRKIAEQFVDYLNQKKIPYIEKLEIAGPGFINIYLNPKELSERVNYILHDSKLGVSSNNSNKKIIIDFSSPNTAKEMHVGHLRSTIIGDSLARIFEFLGNDVLRLNHIGDWGTAFGMLIAYMKEEASDVLNGKQDTDLSHLVTWYKKSKEKFDTDPIFKKKSQQEVVALQGGNKDSLRAWEIICTISEKAYQEIYDLLDVHLVTRGESFYNPMLKDIITELEQKNLIVVSDGAKCLYLDGFINREGQPLPLMLQKSDGGFNYDTTDMAAIKHRIFDEKADRLIYVTDAGQSTHFQMIFQAAKKAGFLNDKKVELDHVPFGLVLGSDGKKFKTRSGDTERLKDLLTTAIDKALILVKERNHEMSEEEQSQLAKALGIGAVKYADLSCNRIGDYLFSYDKMLKFEGNTAAFLMYAYVRINGIKKKVNQSVDQLIEQKLPIILEHPSELALAFYLTRFGEVLDSVSKDLLPNRLADYLYGLSEKFNAFFRDCRVEGDLQQNSRLLLCEATARVLKQGLYLLGLQTVEKM